jgi:hypothetical protein
VALTNRVRSAISRVGAALARVSRIARRHFVTIGGRSRRDLIFRALSWDSQYGSRR